MKKILKGLSRNRRALKRGRINRRTLKGGSVPNIRITENQPNNLGRTRGLPTIRITENQPNLMRPSVQTRGNLRRWTNLNNQMRRERETQAQWTRNHERRIRQNNIQQRIDRQRIREQQERESAPQQVVYNLYVVGDPEFYEQINSDNLDVNLYDATLEDIKRYIIEFHFLQTHYLRDENSSKIIIYTREPNITNEWTKHTRSRNLRDIGMLKNDIDILFEYA